MRYERHFFGLSGLASAVKDRDFFFASDGNENPYNELVETIRAFQEPVQKVANIDQHPICRFPARYKWLKSQSVIANSDNLLAKCTRYQKWRSNGNVTSISIYFATGYFGNPASFFGHPLLKFNVGTGESQMVDASLNYGAMTPENENPVLYVLKGLFGGYSASFTHHDFFYHSHNYSETEMRDLWEYRLNLEPREVDEIVDRTWELLARNHPYFFLVDNCAYRMAELLEEVFDEPLIFRNRLYVIPIDLYIALANGTRKDGRPMVTAVTRVPSRYSRLVEKYNSLPMDERAIVKDIAKDPAKLQSPNFEGLAKKEKAQALETLVDYYSFRKLKEPSNHSFDQLRTQAIRERFKIDEKSGFDDQTASPALPPHLTQKSFGLRVGEVYSDQLLSFQELELRPALYDELNPSVGRPDNTSLLVFDTKFQSREGHFNLRSMDVFRVSTLNTPETDLPGDGNLSWRVQMGLKSQTQLCTDCLVGAASGGVGYSFAPFKEISAYALVTGGLQNNKANQGTLHAGPELGSYMQFYPWWKIHVSYELETFLNGEKSKYDIWKLEQRFGSSQTWDARLEYQQRDDKQLQINFAWFL